jgi:hypothetical protein
MFESELPITVVNGDEFFLGGRALCGSEDDIFNLIQSKP